MMETEAIELIKRVQNQDSKAFEELYQKYYSLAYHTAIQITKNDADAKDVCQETFLQIHHSIKDLHDPKLFPAWMKKIIISKCSRMFERNHYRPVDPQYIAKTNQSSEARRYMHPKKQNDFESDQEILYQMINRLKPQVKEAITLMYFEQMKLQEIAVYLHTPLSTIKSRVKTGRMELGRMMKDFERSEGRKLDFNLNGICSITGLYSLCHWQVIQNKIISICSGNMVNVVCAASITTLSATGAVFAYQDQISGSETSTNIIPQEVAQQKQDEIKYEEGSLTADTESAFPLIAYKQTTIENYMQAYFTCVNWADSKEKMQEKTKEEFLEIQPIYEQLKQEQGTYYTALKELHWVDAYEALASDLNG